MPDCPPFSLVKDGGIAKKGDTCTIKMDPEIKPGCSFKVTLDGQPMVGSTTAGHFQCVGLGGKGEATFRGLRNRPQGGWVEFIVTCDGCGPTKSRQPALLGTGKAPAHFATQIVETLALPLSLPFLLIFTGAWLLCRLICRVWPPPAGQVCECTSAKKAVDAVLQFVPDWVKAPFG